MMSDIFTEQGLNCINSIILISHYEHAKITIPIN